MSNTLAKTWWLLALCGILDAMHAGMNLLMMNPDLRRSASLNTVWYMGLLAVLAGVCAMAAGLWSKVKGRYALFLYGFALIAFGLIPLTPLIKGPLSFRLVSPILAAGAACIGAFAGEIPVRSWFAKAAAVISLGYMVSFVAVGYGWVKLPQPNGYWIWMSSYFGFCAILMMWLAWRGVPAPASAISSASPA